MGCFNIFCSKPKTSMTSPSERFDKQHKHWRETYGTPNYEARYISTTNLNKPTTKASIPKIERAGIHTSSEDKGMQTKGFKKLKKPVEVKATQTDSVLTRVSRSIRRTFRQTVSKETQTAPVKVAASAKDKKTQTKTKIRLHGWFGYKVATPEKRSPAESEEVSAGEESQKDYGIFQQWESFRESLRRKHNFSAKKSFHEEPDNSVNKRYLEMQKKKALIVPYSSSSSSSPGIGSFNETPSYSPDRKYKIKPCSSETDESKQKSKKKLKGGARKSKLENRQDDRDSKDFESCVVGLETKFDPSGSSYMRKPKSPKSLLECDQSVPSYTRKPARSNSTEFIGSKSFYHL